MSEQNALSTISDAFQSIDDIHVHATSRDGADALVRLRDADVEDEFNAICSENGFTHSGGERVVYPSEGHKDVYRDFWVAVE